VGLTLLDVLQQTQQHPWAALVFGDKAIDEFLVLLLKMHFFHGRLLYDGEPR
jgi:hypothetical protein